jgi:hypothetical protein
MNPTQKAIIRTLLYFDIFEHPLDKTELFELNSAGPAQEEFNHDLEELLATRLIGHDSGYYFLGDGFRKIRERLEKQDRAMKHNRIAHIVSGMISRYPFVRAVMVTGSLSKKSQSQKADIDFFVITVPGRLWLCRTMLMLFKKVFLLNSKKYFCINYFIDSVHLEIPEKNIFTATELAFLKPMNNPELFLQLMHANDWIKGYFPNLTVQARDCREIPDTFLKRTLEKVFNGKIGEKLDTTLLRVYRKRSERKFSDAQKHLFPVNFKTEKHVSKHHPNGFQQIIIDQHQSRIAEFEKKHQVILTI